MLKKKIFFSILLSIFVFLSTIYFYQKKTRKEEQSSNYQLKNYEITTIKEGDIILRRGYGIISDMIAKLSKNSNILLSHCGVICKDSNQNWIVIHTVSNTLTETDGMQLDNLATFVKNSKDSSIIIVRYNNTTDSMTTLFCQQAFYYLHKNIPFDEHFDSNDSSKMYCTELIRQLYLNVYHIDIYDQYPKDILRFSPFFDKKLFTVILSHQITTH